MNLDPAKDAEVEAAKGSRGPSRDGGSFGGGSRSGFGGGDRRGGFSRGPSRGGFGGGRSGGGFSRGPRRDFGNSDRPGEAGGPHFPTSRLMGDDQKQTFDR